MSIKSDKADAAATAAEEKVEQKFLDKQAAKPAPVDDNAKQITSTETVSMSDEDFRRLKLIST
jgi:hypothetical protein